MKKYFLLCFMMITIAHADIPVTWYSISANGTFVINDTLKGDVISGTLPPNKPVTGCTVHPIPESYGFTITCNNKIWKFLGSRVACIKGGGGQWIAPDKSKGAYMCGL